MDGGWIIVQPASTMVALVQDAAHKYASLYQHLCGYVNSGGNTRSVAFKTMFFALYTHKYNYAVALFERCVNTELLKFFWPGGKAAPAQYQAAAMNASCLQSFRIPPAPNSKMWWMSPPAMELAVAIEGCNAKTGSV